MSNLNILRKLIEKSNNDLTELKVILDSPSIHIKYESKELASSVLGISKIHAKTTVDAGKRTVGIQGLISFLEKINLSEFLIIIYLQNEDWVGHCVLSPDQSRLLGYAFVERTKNAPKRTPPNWDGSKEMLEEFNKNNPPMKP